MHSVEVNLFNRGVGVVDGSSQIGSGSGHAEDAPARGFEALLTQLGAGVEHLHVPGSVGGFDSRNPIAGSYLTGIAMRRKYHAHRWFGLPAQGGSLQGSRSGPHEGVAEAA